MNVFKGLTLMEMDLSKKDEMMSAHIDRIDKIFIKFDKNGDNKLSKKELLALRDELRRRINKFKEEVV